MNLNETIEMMKSADYQERFKAEYFQVKIRMFGLAKMLEKYKAGTLDFTPSCSYDLLHKQFEIMVEYASVLRERAQIEGIALESESE